jgi:lipopolysaccharide/colanic/teichoic acid biosynthesis glycosyltransferase
VAEADFELYRRLDLYYVDNWSLTHDVKILLKTIVVVLAGRGAH